VGSGFGSGADRQLDPAGLPIAGVEVSRKVLDSTLPSNRLMAREWQGSEGKPI
jgi:carboxymethylenebutenolidase